MKCSFIKSIIIVFTSLFWIQFGYSQKAKYEIKLLDINSEYSDFSPYLFGDDIIFVSDKKQDISNKKDPATKRNFCDLYSNSKNEKTINLLKKINTKYHEGPITATSDGNLVFFTRNSFFQKKKRYSEDRLMPLQIFYVKYENGIWLEEQNFPINNLAYSCGHPSLTADGKFLYYTSDMPGGFGGTDIYRVEYNNGNWGTPENLGNKINSSSNEMFPFVDSDNILYFSSNSPEGLGGLDIWYSEMTKNGFSEKINIGAPINSAFDDFSFIKLYDKKLVMDGYFSSNRLGGIGLDDIYEWKYLDLPFRIEGFVRNSKGEVLPESEIGFSIENGDKIITRTDSNGSYSVVAHRNFKYEGEAQNSNCYKRSFNIETPADETAEAMKYDIILEEFAKFKIKPIDTEGQPIESMTVKIQCNNEETFSTISTTDWIYWEFPHIYHPGDSIHLLVDFYKTGYLNKKVNFDFVIENGGEIVIPKEKETILVTKVEQNMEISKIMELNPIYYDYDKWNIRPDAAVELDKVIKFLNNNPDLTTELSSHTDSRGNDDYNFKLSDKRAKSAANYLKKGLKNPNQIFGKGYGETKLVNQCTNGVDCSDKEHELNRRTEFTIVKISSNNKSSHLTTKDDSSNAPEVENNNETNSDSIIYKVQIFTTSNKLENNSEKFKSHKNVTSYNEDNLFKYTIGESTDIEETRKLRQDLLNDFEGCFIVKFKNGKRLK